MRPSNSTERSLLHIYIYIHTHIHNVYIYIYICVFTYVYCLVQGNVTTLRWVFTMRTLDALSAKSVHVGCRLRFALQILQALHHHQLCLLLAHMPPSSTNYGQQLWSCKLIQVRWDSLGRKQFWFDAWPQRYTYHHISRFISTFISISVYVYGIYLCVTVFIHVHVFVYLINMYVWIAWLQLRDAQIAMGNIVLCNAHKLFCFPLLMLHLCMTTCISLWHSA